MKSRMTLFYVTIIVALALSGLTIFQAWDKLKLIELQTLKELLLIRQGQNLKKHRKS